MDTKDARSLPSVLQEKLRKRAIEAFLQGKSQVAIATSLSISDRIVRKWIRSYKMYGKGSLKAKKKGRPKGSKLLPWQAAQTIKYILNYCPDDLELPFSLWTRDAVALLILKKFSVSLSKWTVGRYLAKWGLTAQKPIRKAFEQNEKEVKKWLSSVYPKIRKRAKREESEIYWGDEMGLRSDHNVGTSFGKRGKTPVVKGTGKRFRCNMISSITNNGRLNFMIFKNRFIVNIFLIFLRRLIRQSHKKVFLIVDQHPVHKAKDVQKWLLRHENDLEIFFLPGYCPELNPDELLNQDVKTNIMGKQRPRSQDELERALRSYLRCRQRQPLVVKRYFQGTTVQYAAQ